MTVKENDSAVIRALDADDAPPLDIKSAQALGLPRLRAAEVVTVKATMDEGATVEDRRQAAKSIRAIRNYFRAFTRVIEGENVELLASSDLCPWCRRPLMGFLGTFTWGIIHGEGNCFRCGYPCRGHHIVHDDDGTEILSVSNFVLPYHPDDLVVAEGGAS